MTFNPYDFLLITIILLLTNGFGPYVTMIIGIAFEMFFGPLEGDDDDDENFY